MLKDPIHIIHDHLTTNIGNPEDFKTVMSRNEDVIKGKDLGEIDESVSKELGVLQKIPMVQQTQAVVEQAPVQAPV